MIPRISTWFIVVPGVVTAVSMTWLEIANRLG
jgi:hypothetical protein